MLFEFDHSLVYNVLEPSSADDDLRTFAIEMLSSTDQTFPKASMIILRTCLKLSRNRYWHSSVSPALEVEP